MCGGIRQGVGVLLVLSGVLIVFLCLPMEFFLIALGVALAAAGLLLPALQRWFDGHADLAALAELRLPDLGGALAAVLPEGLEKADYMRICLAMLDSADAIAPLLSWTRSDGAAIEMSLARYTGKKQIAMWWIP